MAEEQEIHVGDHGDTLTVRASPKSNLGNSGVAVWAEFTKPTRSLAAVLLDDGGVFTDLTTKAKDKVAADTILLPALPVVGDAIYYMGTYRFGNLFFDIPTPGIGTWVLAYEYFNTSDVWATLTMVDDTSDYTDNTPNDFAFPAVTFDIPSDWKKVTVNSIGPFSAIRARVTVGDLSVVTQPVATQVRLGPVQVSGVVTDAVDGKFSITVPKGLFDEPGDYILQTRREVASPATLIRGNASEFTVKLPGTH